MDFPQCFVYLSSTRFKNSFENFVFNFLPILLPNNIAKLVHETFKFSLVLMTSHQFQYDYVPITALLAGPYLPPLAAPLTAPLTALELILG